MKNLTSVCSRIGLSLICLCVLVPPTFADDHDQEIVIRMTDFKFEPNHIKLDMGKTYTLVLVNDGLVPHEWDAPDLLGAIESAKVELKKDGQMVGEMYGTPDEIEVGVGALAEWFFTTTKSTNGPVELICDIEGHLDAGMHGTIEVR